MGIIDDILDFTGTSEVLGKPAMADVSLGLATAPILYAAQEKRELLPLIKRRFEKEGDPEKAYNLVMSTSGVAKAEHLALFHAQSALDALAQLPESEATQALERLRDSTHKKLIVLRTILPRHMPMHSQPAIGTQQTMADHKTFAVSMAHSV